LKANGNRFGDIAWRQHRVRLPFALGRIRSFASRPKNQGQPGDRNVAQGSAGLSDNGDVATGFTTQRGNTDSFGDHGG
jgi:hypothetical protein